MTINSSKKILNLGMAPLNNKKNAISLKIWLIFITIYKTFLEPSKDISAKVNWVYGYRCNDVVKSIEYIAPLNFSFTKLKRIGGKSATEKLIYFTANIIIIYYPKLNEQKHYL